MHDLGLYLQLWTINLKQQQITTGLNSLSPSTTASKSNWKLCYCKISFILFVTGRILFFEQSNLDDRVPVNIVDKDASEIAEIRVTPSWISDHMPSAYLRNLKYSINQNENI